MPKFPPAPKGNLAPDFSFCKHSLSCYYSPLLLFEAAKRLDWLNLAVPVQIPLLAMTKAPELDAETVCGAKLGGLSLSGAGLPVYFIRMPFRPAVSLSRMPTGGTTQQLISKRLR